MNSTPFDATASAVYGLAFGDAIGDPQEFKSYRGLAERYPLGPPVPAKLRITDDTQMSLYVWQALTVSAGRHAADVREALIDAFVMWRSDPDNNRAPGDTCLTATAALARHRNPRKTWVKATVARSSGCGAVMRAPWIGLHPAVADDIAPTAKMQAALTHGHPEAVYTAAGAAELTAALAFDGLDLPDAPRWLLDWCRTEWSMSYDRGALGKLHERCDGMTETEYHQRGVWAVAQAALRAQDLADRLSGTGPWRFDPCTIGGEGWKSADCLATALGIAAGLTEYSAVVSLQQAAMTNGDSDSIGAVCGALVGAGTPDAFGPGCKVDLCDRLEERYRRELAEVCTEAEHAAARPGVIAWP